MPNSTDSHIEPTQNAGRAFVMRNITGALVMLNLLHFREIADYSSSLELAPEMPISGARAFQLYVEHTLPHLRSGGDELIFLGQGGPLLIGPLTEHWDMVISGYLSRLLAWKPI